MKQRLWAIGVLLGCMLIASQPQAAEHEVRMLNQGPGGPMVFDPGFLKVEPGDTVHFLPVDSGHNSHAVLTPEGAAGWQGAIDEKLSVTLDQEGVYLYQCDPHAIMGMVGVIRVGAPKNLAAAEEKAASLSAGMAMNKNRFSDYLGQVQ